MLARKATVALAGGQPSARQMPVFGDCRYVYGYTSAPATADVMASVNSPWSQRPAVDGWRPRRSSSGQSSVKRRSRRTTSQSTDATPPAGWQRLPRT